MYSTSLHLRSFWNWYCLLPSHGSPLQLPMPHQQLHYIILLGIIFIPHRQHHLRLSVHSPVHTHTTYCDEWKNGVSFRSGSTVREALLALGILQMIFLGTFLPTQSWGESLCQADICSLAQSRLQQYFGPNKMLEIIMARGQYSGDPYVWVCLCVYMDVYAASSYYLVYVWW